MSIKPSVTYIDVIANTNIDDTKEDVEDINVEDVEDIEDSEKLRKNTIDLFLPLHIRIKNLVAYYQKEGEQVSELLASIIGMYFFSKTKNLKEYLCNICTLTNIPVSYRIECAKNLDRYEGCVYIDRMFINEKNEIAALPTPIRVDAVIFLMKSGSFQESALSHFCNIILDSTIETLYRYRTIQSLERHFSKEKESFLFYARESCIRFMRDEPLFLYRVLVCQYILEKCEPDDAMIESAETFLLKTVEDVSLDEDLRADACDILLQYGTDTARSSARLALFVLGGGSRTKNNIFTNKQNVHVRAIEESVQKIIGTLSTYHPRKGKVYDFDTAKTEIVERVSVYKNKELIEKEIDGALIRISIDRAVYGNSNMTLSTILAKIWTYIQDSDYTEDLEGRLIEELVESDNKCSSGYASRLVNTLSGYDDEMSISISFEDQITANVEGRLNACIRNIKDEDVIDNILNEMSIPVIHYELRKNFLTFFRQHISKIREELYNEFHTFMTDLDYDFYFRKAIIHYEGCY